MVKTGSEGRSLSEQAEIIIARMIAKYDKFKFSFIDFWFNGYIRDFE